MINITVRMKRSAIAAFIWLETARNWKIPFSFSRKSLILVDSNSFPLSKFDLPARF